MAAAVLIGAAAATAAWTRTPRAARLDRTTITTSTVRQGELRVQVRGTGTLVAEETRWLSARTEGRVETIPVLPGTRVAPDTVILTLGNPQVEQRAAEASLALQAAEAESIVVHEQLKTQLHAREAEVTTADAAFAEARMRSDVDRELFRNGLLPKLNLDVAEGVVRQARARLDAATHSLHSARRMNDATAAQQEARLEQARALAALRTAEADALRVRSGMEGVLVRLSVERGQQIAAGTALAIVADPQRLKAQVLVPETQARDVRPGQHASIDTRNGFVDGVVARIEPSARNGSVVVEIALTGALPAGARVDATIDAIVDVAHIPQTLLLARPAGAAPDAPITLFRRESGDTFVRTRVRLGRQSAMEAEALQGLRAGDVVITSDMSQWDGTDRIRID